MTANAKAQRPWYKKKRFILGGPLGLLVVAAALSPPVEKKAEVGASEVTTTSEAISTPTTQEEPERSEADDLPVLDQMSIGFEGSPSRNEVQSPIDPVMSAYGLEITDENYERAGSSLVTLHDKLGIPEMEILECMSRSRGRWASQGFATGAAYAAFTISEVGECNPQAAGT